MKYSVWITVQNDAVLDIVQNYNEIKWCPHITLASGINLPSHSVAKNLFDSFLFQEKLNFKVKATGIVLKKLYFQCVMLKIEESKELMDLNMACQLHFTGKMEPYWPHLSLVYGTFTEKKQLQLKEEIERKYKTVLELEEKIFAAELWMTPDDVSSWEKNCTSYAKA